MVDWMPCACRTDHVTKQLVYKSAVSLCFICVPSKGLDNKQGKGFNDTAAASLEVHP